MCTYRYSLLEAYSVLPNLDVDAWMSFDKCGAGIIVIPVYTYTYIHILIYTYLYIYTFIHLLIYYTFSYIYFFINIFRHAVLNESGEGLSREPQFKP